MNEIENILDLKLKNNDKNLIQIILSFLKEKCKFCNKTIIDIYLYKHFDNIHEHKFLCDECYVILVNNKYMQFNKYFFDLIL